MSYDIFFVRRDPGQTFEDALDTVEDDFEGGDPGPLSEEELELWDAVLPRAREVLGPDVEVTQEGEETRELTDPATGIGLTFFQGELEIHVPENAARGDEVELMRTVYALARAVEDATGLEGYDPQLGEPVSDTSGDSPTRRRWSEDADTDAEDDRGDTAARAAPAASGLGEEPVIPPFPNEKPRRWWEFWKP